MSNSEDALGVFHGVVTVTSAYFVLFYIFMGIQVKARLDRTPKDQNGVLENDVFRRSGDALSPFYVMADRTLGNFLEQAIPFLTGMWLHAVFVDARVSTALGTIYLVARSLYPFLWSINSTPTHQRPPKLLSCSTFPGYAVNFAFLVSLVLKAAAGIDLTASLAPFGIVAQCVVMMFGGFIASGFAFGFGAAFLAEFLERWFPAEEKED